MPNAQLPQKIAFDLAGSGILVDQSVFVRGEVGVTKTGTKQDQFRDAVAATYTFQLDNYSGRFTPGNVGSAFATTTLAASAAAGATSISSTGFIPAGAWVVIGSGTTMEAALTGTPSGTGPFTIPLLSGIGSYALVNNQSNGAPVVAQQTLIEGMTVCWSVGAQLREGAILTMVPSDDNWSLLTITCDDMLGAASRNTPTVPLAGAAVQAYNPYLYWPLNDPAGSVQAAEATGNGVPLVATGDVTGSAFGTEGITPTGETALLLNTGLNSFAANMILSPAYPANTLGFIGFWVSTALVTTTHQWNGGWILQFNFDGTNVNVRWTGVTSSSTFSFTPPAGANYVSVGITYTLVSGNYTPTANLYVNGVLVNFATSTATTFAPGPFNQVTVTGVGGLMAHLAYTPTLVHEEYAGVTTEANRLALIDATTPQIALATLPVALSTAPIGNANYQGQSVLDMLNQEVRTEQGYMDCATTGTLTSPTQQIRIRERARPATVDAAHTFDAVLEIQADNAAPIQFVRDTTNLIWSDSITGAGSSLVVSEAGLQKRARSATGSDTIDNYLQLDMQAWGTDRINRGQNVALRPQLVLIDNLKLPTDRSADLLAMIAGDRVRINNIPTGPLGITSWDGWLLDKDQLHKSGDDASDLFTLYLQPCTPNPATYTGTSRYAAGATMSIGAVTSTATSFTVTSTDPLSLLGTADLPYTMLVDVEQVTVTAVSGSSSPQTATVTRGANSTTPAAHSAGAPIDVFPLTYYGY